MRKEFKRNYFQHSSYSPYHLSVGAVVFNDHGQILIHRFDRELPENPFSQNIYTLIRETMEPHETIESALARGIKEEAGSEAELVAFLGALTGSTMGRRDKTKNFEKTTLYFAMRLTVWRPEERLKDDPEAGSDLQWREPDELVSLMQRQGKATESADLDESEVIKRLVSLLSKNFKTL